MKTKKSARLGYLCAVGVFLFGSLPTFAQTLADRVPADAMVYVGWQGAAALQPQYEKSNFKGFLAASTVEEFLTEKLPEILSDKMNAEDAAKFKEVRELLRPLWQYPSAFYLGPMNMANPQAPGIRAALLCDAGADGPALVDKLQMIFNDNNTKNVGQPDHVPLAVEQSGSLVVVTFGTLLEKEKITLLHPNAIQDRASAVALTGSKEFLDPMAQVQKDAAFAIYMDVAALRTQVLDIITHGPGATPEMTANAPKVVAALGLNSVTQVALTGGFAGKEWSERGFIGTTGPHTGVLTLFDGAPVTNDTLKLVPKEAIGFSTFHLDLDAILTQTKAGVASVDPAVARKMRQGIAAVNLVLGFDIQKDLLAPLGSDWVLYRMSSAAAPSYTLVKQLKDSATFKTTLAALEAKAAAQHLPYEIKKETVSGTPIESVETPQVHIAWAIVDGKLIVSTYDGLPGAIAHVQKPVGSILDNAQFVAVSKGLGVANPSSLDYADLSKIYAETAPQFTALLALLKPDGIDLPPSLIPDPEKASPFLTPGVSATWSDLAGIHFSSHSAFPGATVLGGQQSGTTTIAAASFSTAILLPSLDRAREQAQRVAEASNLRNITMGCIVYANDHGGKMPASLAELVASNMAPSSVLVTKSSGTLALTLTDEQKAAAAKDWHVIEKDVAAHCDYLYLGKGTTTNDVTDPTSVVLVIAPPSLHQNKGGNIAYYDGHVEWVNFAQLAKTLEATNKFREEKKLEPVDIEKLKAAPTPLK